MTLFLGVTAGTRVLMCTPVKATRRSERCYPRRSELPHQSEFPNPLPSERHPCSVSVWRRFYFGQLPIGRQGPPGQNRTQNELAGDPRPEEDG